jgi:HEAT repeat protein
MKKLSFKDTLQQLATGPELRTAAIYTLSRLDQESLEDFKAIWPAIGVERRRSIVQEMQEIAEVNFEVDFDPIFLLCMADDDAEVRAISVKSLWENENPALIRPLIHLLKTDEAVMVRAAAASTLGKFIYLKEIEETDENEAILAEEALLETIYQATEDIEVRRRAVEAVGFSGDLRVSQIIEAAYYDDDDKMKVSAIFAMGRNADYRWISHIIEELDNDNAELRFEAARACGELEAKEAVSKLAVILDEDPDVEVQEMAVWALGRIGGDMAREVLELCLESDNEALATAAEDALDELNMFSDMMLYDFDDEDEDIELYDDFDELDFDNFNGQNGKKNYLH